MRILVTGASGYLGRHIAGKLLERNYEVFCILRSTSEMPAGLDGVKKFFRMECGEQLYGIMEEIRPELILHTAGMFLGEHSRDNIVQLLDGNIMFPAVLIDAANQAGCRSMISTGSYWQNYGLKDYDPVNLYAASKQAQEDIFEYYKNACQWRILTLQIFDVYGPDDTRRKVLNLVRDLKDGESLNMTAGEQKLYMCHIEDASAAYMQAVNLVLQQAPGTGRKYAVRPENAYTLKEIINMYLEISGKNVKLNWGGRPYKEREFMNPEGIGHILEGWQPVYDLCEGLKQYAAASVTVKPVK